MSLSEDSILILVCLPENTSARITTLDSRPFDPWIVITLTASESGTFTASVLFLSPSLSLRTLSAITLQSPPRSIASMLTSWINCSASCLEVLSG